MQFISEFIIVSVEYMERIANPEKPPLDDDAIKEKRKSFYNKDESDDVRESLAETEKAFKKLGDVSSWSPEVLDEIDAAFVKDYVDEDGDTGCLFFPRNVENLNVFRNYCNDVEQVLEKHGASAPPHAREWFVNYSIWQMREWEFPMPLGTASVVGVLNDMLMKTKNGFAEVSTGYRGYGVLVPFLFPSSSPSVLT
jgi:hypothetical protein